MRTSPWTRHLLLIALMLGVRQKVDDIALAEPGDIDTIYILGSFTNVHERVRRLRRVDLIWVSLPAK